MLRQMYRAPQEARTYFLTFVCAQRRRIFQVERTCESMMQVLETNRAKGRFELHAFVIMPDHVHVVLTPAPDVSLEKAVQFIKGGFSFLLKSKMDVWERGYNETRIRNLDAFMACRAYIENNPVRKHLCASPLDFRFSSAYSGARIDPVPEWFVAGHQG